VLLDLRLPGGDPRFTPPSLIAPPFAIALMDEYFGTLVEFDAITIIRNHGCTHDRPRCDAYDADAGLARQPDNYLWLDGDATGYHKPCCAGEMQEFHRDLDMPGSITINIPLSDQRPGFGPVRYCIMNKTGDGTHVSPNQQMKAMRTYDSALDPLFDPLGYVDLRTRRQHDMQFDDILEVGARCSIRGRRRVANRVLVCACACAWAGTMVVETCCPVHDHHTQSKLPPFPHASRCATVMTGEMHLSEVDGRSSHPCSKWAIWQCTKLRQCTRERPTLRRPTAM
jgi:hypothetical protein